MMSFWRVPPIYTIRWLLLCFVLSASALSSLLLLQESPQVTGALTLRTIGQRDTWRTLESEQVENGSTVPEDTHVIFHLPVDMPDITRETLLSNRGENIRYWGYCFPVDYDYEDPPKQYGFPGRLFLSEAERDERERRELANRPQYSVFRPPTRRDLQRDIERPALHGLIRHELEVFHGGDTCYIMTADPLPIGTDRDGDLLSSQLEKQYGTDPNSPDTDEDGLPEGIEISNFQTDPLNRDTDGDGLLDSIEVHNHDSLVLGDTNPLKADSDHDGLCDGYCRVDRAGQYCANDSDGDFRCIDTGKRWSGEDRNLDGVFDNGETDPLLWSTPGDGISDSEHYYRCLLEGGSDC